MTRPLDRALGRAAPAAGDDAFSTRAFGTTKATAAAIAASAAAVPGGSTVTGTTGASGSGSNMTSSTYSGASSGRGQIQ